MDWEGRHLNKDKLNGLGRQTSEQGQTEWTGKADIWTRTKTKDRMWKLATATSKLGPWWAVSCEWSTTDRSLTLIRPHLTHWTPDGCAGHHHWWCPSVIAHWQMSPAQIFLTLFTFMCIPLNSTTCSTNTHIKILVWSIMCEEKTEQEKKQNTHTHTHIHTRTHTHTCVHTHKHRDRKRQNWDKEWVREHLTLM